MSQGYLLYRRLLLHGPSDGVTVILELNFANCSQADGAFAAVVVIKELVGCAEVAGLAGAVGFGSRNFLIALLIVIVGLSLILRGLVAVEVLEEGVNLCEG